MPPVTYARNKENILKYQKNHPVDKALHYKYCKTWVINNRDKYNDYHKTYNQWKRIQKVYLQILFV